MRRSPSRDPRASDAHRSVRIGRPSVAAPDASAAVAAAPDDDGGTNDADRHHRSRQHGSGPRRRLGGVRPRTARRRPLARALGATAARINAAFPAAQWVPVDRPASAATVPLCGDDDAALAIAARLVRDARGIPAILPGGLARARQLEEAAGFVIGLAFSGADPAAAVPHVPVHAG